MRAIDLVTLDELKVVYFDVDGVLSIPRYPLGKDNKIIPFAEIEKWSPFVNNNVDAYDMCFAPTAIIDWMKKLKEHNIIIKTLTASIDPEKPSKTKFIKTFYSDYISDENIIIVPNTSDKITTLLNEQTKLNLDPFEMALVEDNHYVLFDVNKYRFRGIHVSWFLDTIEK